MSKRRCRYGHTARDHEIAGACIRNSRFERVYVSHPIKGQTELQIQEMETRGREYVTDVLRSEPLLPRTISVLDHSGRPCPQIMDAGQGADHDWSCYMRADIIEMLRCDAILMMPGWTKSKGATLELYICLQTGIPAFFYEQTQEWRERPRSADGKGL